MAVALIKDEKFGSENSLIARDLTDYLDKKMMLPHLHLLCAYDNSFFSEHFNFLKQKESLTGVRGFLSIHSGLQSYVMHHNLLHLSLHWKESTIFKAFVRTYEMVQDPPYEIENLMTNFFRLAISRYEKHFNQW